MRKLWLFLVVFLSCIFFNYCGNAQIINTFAGNGTPGNSGDGNQATTAELKSPSGVAVDTSGNVYITDQDNNNVRKVTPAGIISTIAGTGTRSYTGDGGAATAATLYWPEGVAADRYGNIYIADQFNNVVRKVNAAGIISTIAGSGTTGYSGDGGPATAGELWHPVDVGVDYAGNVYALDQDNSAVRKITISTGIITTIAGSGASGFSGDGGPATAALLNFPQGIAVDSAGNVWVADFYNSRVRAINAATGIITTVAGGGTSSAEGIPATAASFANTSALSRDQSGNLYVTDCYAYRVRKIYTSGIINTIAGNGTLGFAGDGGPATAGEINVTEGIAVNDSGNLFIADFGNSRVRIITKIPALATLSPILGTDTVCIGSSTALYDTTTLSGGVWTSSRIPVASVGSASGIVTGVSAGTVVITYSVAGSYTTFSVHVKACPNGINSPENSSAGIMVYPNPSTGAFFVKLADEPGSNSVEDAEIVVSNMVGARVVELHTKLSSSGEEVQMQVAPGVYYLTIKTATNYFYRKIIVSF